MTSTPPTEARPDKPRASSEPQFIDEATAEAERRPLNRFAIASLITAACLLAPVGAVLGIIAVIQIRNSGGKQQGMVLAAMGLVMSLAVLPAAGVLLLTADPAVFDSCRVLQHQAEGTLRVMRFLEERYKEQNGRYGPLDEIDFKSMYGERPYRYEIVEHNAETFLARATGVDAMAGDVMEVRAGGKLTRVHDVCEGEDRPRP